MKNPWEDIPLNEYEGHMKLETVGQLQAMNKMMKGQFDAYPVSSVMILGVAGGNGLSHVDKGKYKKVIGVDVNPDYLREAVRRYPDLKGVLECLCIDLLAQVDKLPQADMVIANLLIEYIGCECFQKVIRHVKPRFVSCIIQADAADHWVSDSPYLHVFDKLEPVHQAIEEQALGATMAGIGYSEISTLERALPNGKKLVQMDFEG